MGMGSNSSAQLRDAQKSRDQQERFFRAQQAESSRQFDASMAFQNQQAKDMRQLSRVSPSGTPTAVDASMAANDMGRLLLKRKGFDKFRFAA
jgi:hypothetical protein